MRYGATLQFICEQNASKIDVALGLLHGESGTRGPHHIFVAMKSPRFEVNVRMP